MLQFRRVPVVHMLMPTCRKRGLTEVTIEYVSVQVKHVLCLGSMIPCQQREAQCPVVQCLYEQQDALLALRQAEDIRYLSAEAGPTSYGHALLDMNLNKAEKPIHVPLRIDDREARRIRPFGTIQSCLEKSLRPSLDVVLLQCVYDA